MFRVHAPGEGRCCRCGDPVDGPAAEPGTVLLGWTCWAPGDTRVRTHERWIH